MNEILLRPVVVNCPPFDEKIGGSVVLHYLVDRLRKIGVDAYAYPITPSPAEMREMIRQRYGDLPLPQYLTRTWNFRRKAKRIRLAFRKHPTMNVPIANRKILKDAIVIYPEVVIGNPLRSRHVVRWLLAHPGSRAGQISDFGDDIVYYYRDAYGVGIRGLDVGNRLRLRWFRDDVYVKENSGERQGICVFGEISGSCNVSAELKGAIAIDGLSHSEIAKIFNQTEKFYSYAPHTMFTTYAAMCGCIPVVVPQKGVSREAWRPEKDFFGVAYGDGVDQITWARNTRDELLKACDDEKAKQDLMVSNFAERLKVQFS